MSYKLGLMLSLVIFMQSFLMIFDMYNVQLINSELVLGSNYVNNLILKEGGINEEIIDYVEDIMKGNIYLETDNYPGPGKTLTYTIIIKYQRIYTKSIEEMKISRSVLFGYTLM